MTKSLKKNIAKEIIIFFSCTIIILLIWCVFYFVNIFNISKTENLNKQIVSLTNVIDSIQNSCSKPKSFLDLTEKDWYQYIDINDHFGSTLEKLHSEIEENANITLLFKLLIESNYNFPFFRVAYESSIPDYKYFLEDIEEGLFNDTILNERPPLKLVGEDKKPPKNSLSEKILNNVFTFLKGKQLILVDYNEFVQTLNYTRSPRTLPVNSTDFDFSDSPRAKEKNISNNSLNQKYEENKKELKVELEKTKLKTYSKKDLSNIAKWTGIIVFLIVYPVRFILLLLIWAIKTLRHE